MALTTFNVELGFGILTENGQEKISLIRSAGAPDGTSNGQSEANEGSLLLTESGELYKKIANAGAASDWKRISSEDASDSFLTSALDILTNGTIADGDSVEVALGKLQANHDDLLTTVCVTQGYTDMGTYTGGVLTDNQSVKTNIQELETAIDNISGGSTEIVNGITTAQVLGLELVDNSDYCEFEVVIKESASPDNKKIFKIGAVHDGTTSADATQIKNNKFSRIRIGSNFNVSVDAVLQGSGVTQEFGIEISSTEVSGVDAIVRKVCL